MPESRNGNSFNEASEPLEYTPNQNGWQNQIEGQNTFGGK